MPKIDDLPAASSVAGADLVLVSQSGVAKKATVSLLPSGSGLYYNVVDYGADPTGVADSQSAIQDAINAAEAAGGGTVYFPPGDYTVDAGDLTVDSAKVTLLGEGPCSEIGFGVGDQLRILADNTTVIGLRLNGPGAGTQSTNEADAGILVKGTSGTSMIGNVTIRNCQIINFRGDGIHARYCNILQVLDNRITTCGYAGVGCYSCSDITIKGNTVADINVAANQTNAYGITLSSYGTGGSSTDPICRRAVIADNVVTTVNNWTGIDMHGGEDCAITGNTVTGSPFGIKVASHTITFNQSAKRVTVSGNVVSGTLEQDGIIVRGAFVSSVWQDLCDAVVVTGNSVYNAGTNTSSQGGITLEGTRGCTVSGNSIYDCQRHGIVLYQQNYGFTVSGNTVKDPHSSTAAVGCGAVAIVGDYQTGYVGGNSLIRGSLSANSVATAMIVRSSGTTANSVIDFDYSYSQHTGSDYYSGTLETHEWTQQRRSDHIRYTGALSLSGFSTTPTMTVYVSKVGDLVTIRFPVGLTGTATSNSADFATTTALPAEFRPARAQYGIIRFQDNSSTLTTPGIVEIGTGGIMTFGKDCSALGGFTTSGTKTTQGGTVTYSVY